MAAVIRAENLHKRYVIGRHTIDVLRGAALEVEAGESISVVGISGAGKSTLLHILGGLDGPDAGRVKMDGDDLYALSRARRTEVRAAKIGFVFQSYHLLPEMDVLENVLLPAMALRGVFSYAAARRRAAELLDHVGLADRAVHTPKELSGGEQQRVALARALMNEPQVVLADEPTGNLDDGTGGQVLDALFALTRKRGHTLILVTHDEKIAWACDRRLRLAEGRLNPA